ncbi:hypothetical protein BU17DRAFT_103811 [Hysterangium stoloniferum]|nr:hypothetical protein BU17DRAFT_103811 [Hysterangium stoloniferum]
MHIGRDERITAMCKETSGRVVGPVRAEDFLSQYLPKTRNPCPELTADTLKAFSQSKSEFAMYKPWRSGLSDITQTKMTVEFKIAVNDAFNDSGPFERSSKTARDTLGQITLYAMAHQAAQFRAHVFLVLVFPKYARFMRWDRSGVIITEKVPFSNPSYLQFFWRFNNASPAARGVDTTATEFPHNHLVAVKAERSLGIEDGDRLFQVKLDPKAHNYVFRRPHVHGCRISPRLLDSCFPGLLRRNWESSEHMIYEQLNKRGIRNICTCKQGCDTLDQFYQDAGFINEMVTPVRDAITAHGDAYDRAEILHIYVNSGNIVITHIGGGLLIDWDLCKSFNIYIKDKPALKGMSTSPSFRILLGILLNFLIPTHGELPPTPDRADDLESFFYVLVCIALRYTEHRFVKGGDKKKPEVPTSDPFQVSRLFNVSLKELIKTLTKTIAVRYEEAPKATEIAQYKQLFEKQGSSGVKPLHLSGLADDDAVLSTLLAGKHLTRVAALGRSDWMASELTTALQKSGWNEHGDCVQRDLSSRPHNLWHRRLSVLRVALLRSQGPIWTWLSSALYLVKGAMATRCSSWDRPTLIGENRELVDDMVEGLLGCVSYRGVDLQKDEFSLTALYSRARHFA